MSLSSSQDWHPADLIAALKKLKLSLKQLSRDNGYSPDVLKVALRRPYPKAEKIIAQALGLNAAQIWPSRYTGKGESARRPGRPKSYPAGANASAQASVSKGGKPASLQEFTVPSANSVAVSKALTAPQSPEKILRRHVLSLRASHSKLASAAGEHVAALSSHFDALALELDRLDQEISRIFPKPAP